MEHIKHANRDLIITAQGSLINCLVVLGFPLLGIILNITLTSKSVYCNVVPFSLFVYLDFRVKRHCPLVFVTQMQKGESVGHPSQP